MGILKLQPVVEREEYKKITGKEMSASLHDAYEDMLSNFVSIQPDPGRPSELYQVLEKKNKEERYYFDGLDSIYPVALDNSSELILFNNQSDKEMLNKITLSNNFLLMERYDFKMDTALIESSYLDVSFDYGNDKVNFLKGLASDDEKYKEFLSDNRKVEIKVLNGEVIGTNEEGDVLYHRPMNKQSFYLNCVPIVKDFKEKSLQSNMVKHH